MAKGTIVLDACILITYGNATALEVLTDLRSHRVVSTTRAIDEVERDPARAAISAAVAAGSLDVEDISLDAADDQAALAHYDALPAFRGLADAEVLAIAAARGWIVGSDDIAVQREAGRSLGPDRYVGTIGFLRWAVAEGRLVRTEAITLLNRLDVALALIKRLEGAGQTPDDLFDDL